MDRAGQPLTQALGPSIKVKFSRLTLQVWLLTASCLLTADSTAQPSPQYPPGWPNRFLSVSLKFGETLSEASASTPSPSERGWFLETPVSLLRCSEPFRKLPSLHLCHILNPRMAPHRLQGRVSLRSPHGGQAPGPSCADLAAPPRPLLSLSSPLSCWLLLPFLRICLVHLTPPILRPLPFFTASPGSAPPSGPWLISSSLTVPFAEHSSLTSFGPEPPGLSLPGLLSQTPLCC